MRKDIRLADRMLEILIDGVSTRRYEGVLPEMAESVDVSKSQVSRETIEADDRLLKELAGRDLSGLELLAIWIDGLQLGGHHVICAMGVDARGNKHMLGLREGATENAAGTKALLEELVRRVLDPARPRLFVIDGSKALRLAIDAVFGADQLLRRCRDYKQRNVISHLPQEQQAQALATMRAAFKLEAAEGIAQLEQYAFWLVREWRGAAASLREGLEELFTVNRLGLTSSLRRCLGTTNLIDNGHSAARERMHRVKHRQSGEMTVRWTAPAFEAASKDFRRIMGNKDLWMLEALLSERDRDLVLRSRFNQGE